MKNNIAKMYAFQFFFGLYFISGVLVPFFMEWGGLSFTEITVLQAWFVFWVFALEAPTGAVADYFGRKVAIIIGCMIFITGIIAYSITPYFGLFLLGEFLWALSRSLISGTDSALVYDSLRDTGQVVDSKKTLGRFRSLFLVGMAVGAPIGSIIAHFVGLREVLLFMIVPSCVALAIATTLKEPKKSAGSLDRNYFSTLAAGLRYLKGHRIVKILAFDQITVWTMLFMMIWVYQLVLREIGVSIVYFGVVHAGILGVQIVLLNKLGFMERIFRSRRRYLFASALLPGLGLIALAFIHWLPLAIFLIALIVGLGLPRRTLIENYMHKYIESDQRATVMSFINMTRSGFQAVCYPLIGFLVDWSLWYALLILGILVLAATFASRIREEYLID